MNLTAAALFAFLREDLGLAADPLDEETVLFSSGLLDSFSMVDLILYIESTTGRRMRPGEVRMANLDSVRAILDYAERAASS